MSWLRQNRSEVILILLVLAVAIFLRFYRIADYMTFMGDEGRDALVVRDIIVGHNLPLVGPAISFSTDAGALYLGPLYYYMMAASMWLSGLNPVGAAVMMAVIGVLAVALIYYLARAWFGKEAALLTSFAYATAPAVVAYARTSWNPNPAPFFAMLAVLGVFRAFQTKNMRWFILTGGAVAFAAQMHYMALILIPVTVSLWAWNLYLKLARAYRFHAFVSGTIISVFTFLILMSPLVWYDIQHGFANFNAFKSVFFAGGSFNLNPLENLLRMIEVYSRDLVGVYVAAVIRWLTLLMSIIVIAPLVVALALKLRGKELGWPFLALAVWLGLGLLGLALYRREIYPHYLGFLSPVPFLLLGGLISLLPQRLRYASAGLLALSLALITLQKNPLMYPPARQLERTEKIARLVIKISGDKPYNFALLAGNNYDAGYRFYLERYNHPPRRLPQEVTEQLFVVCEDTVCEPAASSNIEVAAFGPSVVDEECQLSGARIVKLSHKP
jgi:4-amino-4-deoxy-L-arabinose transferase-like glycosyltransferase